MPVNVKLGPNDYRYIIYLISIKKRLSHEVFLTPNVKRSASQPADLPILLLSLFGYPHLTIILLYLLVVFVWWFNQWSAKRLVFSLRTTFPRGRRCIQKLSLDLQGRVKKPFSAFQTSSVIARNASCSNGDNALFTLSSSFVKLVPNDCLSSPEAV